LTTDIAAASELLSRLPAAVNAWPWLAFVGIALIFAAIALRGRRQAPYGF
jgi:hypothetical protein